MPQQLILMNKMRHYFLASEEALQLTADEPPATTENRRDRLHEAVLTVDTLRAAAEAAEEEHRRQLERAREDGGRAAAAAAAAAKREAEIEAAGKARWPAALSPYTFNSPHLHHLRANLLIIPRSLIHRRTSWLLSSGSRRLPWQRRSSS